MFQNAREIFKIFGFRIKIDPSWFIIAALIVWSLSASYFPDILPQASQTMLITISLAAMLGLFISLVLHELSHSLVARKFNLNVGSITLFIFGGVAELERDPESAKSEFWIAVAGPIMSFMLGFLFLILARFTAPDGGDNAVSAVFGYLGFINLVLAIFNLIPAFPLDGGRILRAILWQSRGDVLSATRIASRAGSFFAILLISLGILSFFSSQLVAGIWQVLIGLFVLNASKAAYGDLVLRQTLKNHTVSTLMTRNPWFINVNDTVLSLVDNIMLKHNVSFVPVLDGVVLLGYVDAAMIQTIEQDNWNDTKVGDIFIAADKLNTISSSAQTEDVFDKMVKTGNRKLMIVDGDRLEGVISLSDLMAFLSIRSGLGLSPGYKKQIREPLLHA